MLLLEDTLTSIQFRHRQYDWIKYRLDVMTSLKVIKIFKPYITMRRYVHTVPTIKFRYSRHSVNRVMHLVSVKPVFH